MSDIYGANLYNRYLQAPRGARAQLQAHQGGGESQGEALEDSPGMTSTELGGGSGVYGVKENQPEACVSILVCTGVYSRDQEEPPPDPHHTASEHRIFHGHRDFRFDPSLTQPSFLVEDVREAVELVFQKEGCPLE